MVDKLGDNIIRIDKILSFFTLSSYLTEWRYGYMLWLKRFDGISFNNYCSNETSLYARKELGYMAEDTSYSC